MISYTLRVHRSRSYLDAGNTCLLHINHNSVVVSTQHGSDSGLESTFRWLTEIRETAVYPYEELMDKSSHLHQSNRDVPGKIRFRFDTVSRSFA